MKFAYLIMAHNNPRQLEILLELLDYNNNDIYLHIDKKNNDIDVNSLANIVKHATLHVYNKYKVYHADISQTKCQTYLLERACQTYHDYYHLISNADLPLRTNNEIVEFFEENRGKQFVHFESDEYCPKEVCTLYHYGSSFIMRSKNSYLKFIMIKLEKKLLELQRKLSVNRKFYCGANWYSITHELATDFCANRKQIIKRVRWTKSSDELVLQTFLRDITGNHYEYYAGTKSCDDYYPLRREIDWNRGNPYVWKSEDYDFLINSGSLFARKFDMNVDEEVILRIANHVTGRVYEK